MYATTLKAITTKKHHNNFWLKYWIFIDEIQDGAPPTIGEVARSAGLRSETWEVLYTVLYLNLPDQQIDFLTLFRSPDLILRLNSDKRSFWKKEFKSAKASDLEAVIKASTLTRIDDILDNLRYFGDLLTGSDVISFLGIFMNSVDNTANSHQVFSELLKCIHSEDGTDPEVPKPVTVTFENEASLETYLTSLEIAEWEELPGILKINPIAWRD